MKKEQFLIGISTIRLKGKLWSTPISFITRFEEYWYPCFGPNISSTQYLTFELYLFFENFQVHEKDKRKLVNDDDVASMSLEDV